MGELSDELAESFGIDGCDLFNERRCGLAADPTSGRKEAVARAGRGWCDKPCGQRQQIALNDDECVAIASLLVTLCGSGDLSS